MRNGETEKTAGSHKDVTTKKTPDRGTGGTRGQRSRTWGHPRGSSKPVCKPENAASTDE